MRDDVALVAFGLDGGGHHEHAFLGRHQHELMLEGLLRARRRLRARSPHPTGMVRPSWLSKCTLSEAKLSCGTIAISHRQRPGSTVGGDREREMHADERWRILPAATAATMLAGQRLASLGPGGLRSVDWRRLAPARSHRNPQAQRTAPTPRARGCDGYSWIWTTSGDPPPHILTGESYRLAEPISTEWADRPWPRAARTGRRYAAPRSARRQTRERRAETPDHASAWRSMPRDAGCAGSAMPRPA